MWLQVANLLAALISEKRIEEKREKAGRGETEYQGRFEEETKMTGQSSRAFEKPAK